MSEEQSEKARRRAARQLVGEYHERELARLLEHVREGFARLDAGEIDAFDLDELIHRYKRSARELWKFCSNRPESVVWAIEDARSRDEDIDWWATTSGSAGRDRCFATNGAVCGRPRRRPPHCRVGRRLSGKSALAAEAVAAR